jgi:predicted amidophosphoribosyltransferase
MNIKQCARCDKLFEYRGNPNCPNCVQELDDIFVKVRNFLYDHPRADADAIHEACGADEEDVLRWLREGRLILSPDSAAALLCQICGEPIRSGRFCESCNAKVINQLENTAQHFAGQTRPRYDHRPALQGKGRQHLEIQR